MASLSDTRFYNHVATTRITPVFSLFLTPMTARQHFLLIISIGLISGCANQTTPTGGKRDNTAPKLVRVLPVDSLKNTQTKKIELYFDEYITLTDAAKEMQISPILAIAPQITGLNKKVTVKIADSLLEPNTTYRISFGTAIRDLHEGNKFENYTYTFSTGPYFDSLRIDGRVINAATGLPDTSGITVMLYYSNENDSAIVRHKPKYITHPNSAGQFTFKGLPKRAFRIYAIKDANDNLVYDGSSEMIAFHDTLVVAGDSTSPQPVLAMFTEPDTSTQKNGDTPPPTASVPRSARAASDKAKEESTFFTYTTNLDTTRADRRTFDVNKYISLDFNRLPILRKERITLSMDSNGTSIPVALTYQTDTAHPNRVSLNAQWQGNTVYTLRLAKGFAKDTAGTEASPSKNIFRTKQEEDYGKITVHVPARFNSKRFVLQVINEQDTIYRKPISDTTIVLSNLKPAKYNFRIIEDVNQNGHWDPGNLFLNRQPERVFPYPNDIILKPGWENVIDFEASKGARNRADRPGSK